MQATSDGAVVSRSTTTELPTVGFGATLRSEWSKIMSVRTTWISLVLALVLSVGLTMLLAWAVGLSFDDLNEADQATFDPITLNMSGLLVAGIIFVVLGVNLVASEYSSGMIRQTLSTTPKRGRVLMAKVIVVGAIALVAGTVINIAVMVAGNIVLGAYDLPTAKLSDGDTLQALFGLTLTTPVFPILGVAVAFLLRSAAGAITAVLALLFLPSMFGQLLPQRWQEDVLGWLPGPLTDSVSIGFLDPDGAMVKNAWVAGGALIVWLALFLGAAWWFLTKRDA